MGGFVVKLLAAKVIRQHMFFFTLSYFLDKLVIFEIEKIYDIVLVHENHDKWLYLRTVQRFCSGLDHADLVSSFRGSKYLLKIRISNVNVFEYEHLKRFV